jgi:hypothetical protein
VAVLAAAVCPHPPLLVPAVAAGAAFELDALRSACAAVVRRLVDLEPESVVVVGDSPVAIDADESAFGSLAGFGVDLRVGAAADGSPSAGAASARPLLPLSLTIGAWLLDQAGWNGPRRYRGLIDTTTSEDAAALGAALAVGSERVAVLVMGDGSARRSTTAPGYLDERAALFDATVASALATADTAALLSLDAGLATELLAAGRAPWQVLGGLISADESTSGRSWTGDLLVDVAPYGVGYLVATACPEPATR